MNLGGWVRSLVKMNSKYYLLYHIHSFETYIVPEWGAGLEVLWTLLQSQVWNGSQVLAGQMLF